MSKVRFKFDGPDLPPWATVIAAIAFFGAVVAIIVVRGS